MFRSLFSNLLRNWFVWHPININFWVKKEKRNLCYWTLSWFFHNMISFCFNQSLFECQSPKRVVFVAIPSSLFTFISVYWCFSLFSWSWLYWHNLSLNSTTPVAKKLKSQPCHRAARISMLSIIFLHLFVYAFYCFKCCCFIICFIWPLYR